MQKTSFIKKITSTKAFGLLIITIVVWLVFFILNSNFVAIENLNGIMNACSLSGTIAIGLACLMMSGSIDLAAGAEGAMGGVVCAMLLQAGLPWGWAILLTIVCGILMGLINAFWVNVLNLMPFISTIAMSSIFAALAQIISDSNAIAVANPGFLKLGSGHLWVFPMPFVIMVVLMVLYALMLNFTKFGRRLILCGGNRTAARLSGVNYKKITTIMFANSGAVAALAGAILAARMCMGNFNAVIGEEMKSMTAAIMGGVSFLGGGECGMGTIFVALILVNSFNNGLQVVHLSNFWQFVTQGGLLILALIVDYFREKQRIKSLKAK